jgi:hypothetical protein
MKTGGVGGKLRAERDRRHPEDSREPDRALLAGMRPRREHHRATRRYEPGDQTGTQQRGFPAARRPEHAKKSMGSHPGQQIVNQLIPTKEPLGVTDLERGQSDIRRLIILDDNQVGGLGGNTAPSLLPFRGVAATGPHIGQRDGQTGQFAPPAASDSAAAE